MHSQKPARSHSPVSNASNRVTTVLSVVYLALLYWILLLKLSFQLPYRASRSVNLLPFSEPLMLNGKPDVGEMILNVVVFVPAGIYAGILFQQWRLKRKLFIIFLLSLLVEVLQFILVIGSFDSTDLLTNTAGGLIGLATMKGLQKVLKSPARAQKLINVLATIATGLITLFLVLLKLEMLPIRYR